MPLATLVLSVKIKVHMRYSNVVALVDSYLERLSAARELLAQSSWSMESIENPPGEKKTRTPSVAQAAAVVEEVQEPLQSEAVAESLAVMDGAPVVPREQAPTRVPARPRRNASPRKAAEPAVKTALSGSVPTGPVFVPANQVRVEETTRADGQVKQPELFEEEPPLTVESLSRRWLQSAPF